MAEESSIRPLLLNLLAEEQLAEIKEARDPLKLSIAISVGILLVTAIIGSLLQLKAEQKRREVGQLTQKYDQLLKMLATGDTDSLKDARDYCDDIIAMNRGRVVYAPQLALIKEIVPDSIQLNRVTIGIVSEVKEMPAPPADSGKKIRRPAVPQTKDFVNCVIDGQATGARPEIEIDNFLQSMRSDPRLQNQVESIQLRSIAPGSAPANASGTNGAMSTAAFVIECKYKELIK